MDTKTTNSLLTFRLQDELFALSVNNVLEIIETGDEHEITNIPKAPPAISGVVNFRGRIVPVIETRIKFDMTPYARENKFVIMVLNIQLNDKEILVGAMADKVIDVIEISDNEIMPVPEMGQAYNAEFLKGIINRDNSFIMLLNLNAIITSKEIINLKLKETAIETNSQQEQ